MDKGPALTLLLTLTLHSVLGGAQHWGPFFTTLDTRGELETVAFVGA